MSSASFRTAALSFSKIEYATPKEYRVFCADVLKLLGSYRDLLDQNMVLARQFEGVGIQMLTVHGRTREQGYKGMAEYDTIAEVKSHLRIPVVANGDCASPEGARCDL